MPAQLDGPSPSPALCRRSEGWALFWFVFPPPFLISPVLFVSLALWVGIAATCWLSDSWANCPLTVPSPEQKSRRGSPSVCPHLLLLCLWKALALLKTPSAFSGEARASRSCLQGLSCPSVGSREGVELPAGNGLPWPIATLAPAYRASSPVVFLDSPFTATSVRVEAWERWELWSGKVRPPALVAVELPHPLLDLVS